MLSTRSKLLLLLLLLHSLRATTFGTARRTHDVVQDPDAVAGVYEDVRNDASETTWAVLVYDGKEIVVQESGTDYADLLSLLTDDSRNYAYVRFETGDEMSRRAKFAFITWSGPSVSPLKKAKTSTDKAFVKKIWTKFGKEILADEKSELKYEKVLQTLEAAAGAAYGTGKS